MKLRAIDKELGDRKRLWQKQRSQLHSLVQMEAQDSTSEHNSSMVTPSKCHKQPQTAGCQRKLLAESTLAAVKLICEATDVDMHVHVCSLHDYMQAWS